MTLNLNAFLTALYIVLDDLYQKRYAHLKPRRPGRRLELSDSEVLTLSIWAQWFGTSERDHEHVRTVGDCGWAGKRLGEHVVEHRAPPTLAPSGYCWPGTTRVAILCQSIVSAAGRRRSLLSRVSAHTEAD